MPIGLVNKSFSTGNSDEKRGTKNSSIGIGGVSPLTLYQLVDSCVPSGGFAHSNTLEAAHQLHFLNLTKSSWRVSLREHCFDVLLQTFTTTVPFIVEACDLFRLHYHNHGQKLHNDIKETLPPPPEDVLLKWERLDMELRATMNSHVACRASTTQGSGMLRAFSAAFPNISPVIKVLRRRIIKMMPIQVSQADSSGHAATCFGAVCGLLDINNETCVSMFLYTTARDMVNAAVRMNLIGPLEGGCVTNELCSGVNKLIEMFLDMIIQSCRDEDDSQVTSGKGTTTASTNIGHQVAPLVEVLSNAHDRLYTRLFNS